MDDYQYILKLRKGKKFNNKKHKRRVEDILHSLGIELLLEVPKVEGCIKFVISYDSPLDDKARLLDFILRSSVDLDEVVLIPLIDRKPYLNPDLDREDIVGS